MANSRLADNRKLYRDLADRGRLFALLALLLGCTAFAFGQDDDVAPPPLKLLSQDEKAKLATETEVKRRTRLTMDLMEARLVRAETLAKSENYDEMFKELGSFHALMDNMLEFLNKSDKDSNKVLSNFKRFEIGLRGFTIRIEIIRTALPIRYELYPRSLVKSMRAARAKAIEPLFDDSVVPVKNPV